jgi:uncharacterized metal-binding protein YceD (DUF177 family)
MSAAPEFSFPVDVAMLPPMGRHYTITASDEERARVAARLDLQKVDELSAAFEVKPAAGGQIKVTGQVRGVVVQTCVVSLAPVPAQVSETVEAAFITEERAAKDHAKREKAKASGKALADEDEALGAEDDDPPEVAAGGRIDLGELTVAQLALGLDPYPRAPGAAFDAKTWGGDPESAEKAPQTSPFAALAQLKSRSKKPT